ncbi:PIN domain-containing protein [Streptomyces sp. NPDC088360]|uniref:PIN domain-containing protein n=1 Tax=Streptomyces sp. NPDC088360 TaxID=3154515 RepID=UPI003450FD4E
MSSSPCTYLIDTCAAVTMLREPELHHGWERRLTRGTVAMCPVILLEMLVSARSSVDRVALQEDLDTLFVPLFSADFADDTALAFQEAITEHSWQQSPRAVDLLCAANAALFGLQTLSLDTDFVRISDATGLPNTRIHCAEDPSTRPRFWESTTPPPAAAAAA